MLPRATHTRGRREAAAGKQIGPHPGDPAPDRPLLRAVVDMKALGERQITVDCDVLQADGGTRTASITGAWVALRLATRYLLDEGVITTDPILDQVAAVSCGIFNGTPVLDLDYEEDSNAEADSNFVLTGNGRHRRDPGHRREARLQPGASSTPCSRWPARGRRACAHCSRRRRAGRCSDLLRGGSRGLLRGEHCAEAGRRCSCAAREPTAARRVAGSGAPAPSGVRGGRNERRRRCSAASPRRQAPRARGASEGHRVQQLFDQAIISPLHCAGVVLAGN